MLVIGRLGIVRDIGRAGESAVCLRKHRNDDDLPPTQDGESAAHRIGSWISCVVSRCCKRFAAGKRRRGAPNLLLKKKKGNPGTFFGHFFIFLYPSDTV